MDENSTRENLYVLGIQSQHRFLRILGGFPTLDPSLAASWRNLAPQQEIEAMKREMRGSVFDVAVECLNEGDPRKKAIRSLAATKWLREGNFAKEFLELCDDPIYVPDEPKRNVTSVKPHKAKSGNLIHSLAHIESVAIDLAWDLVARFGPSIPEKHRLDFVKDWAIVAEDEARHFLMWSNRLIDLKSMYGAVSTHSALWDTAWATSGDVLERLAIEHMVLEARGLDVAASTFSKFLSNEDEKSACMLEAIFSEEISHVSKGVKWFRILCGENRNHIQVFKRIVREKFRGNIKPPFNEVARSLAGMDREFYNVSS